MSSEPGGRADKLGNEFERLWAVQHLIELIAGKATTFQMEALGDDERGAEFWVGRPNGTREAHQCKRENGAVAKWSVADLHAKGVIRAAKFQLDRDASQRFIFASGDKASHLSDLCERVDRCDTPAEFVDHLTTTSPGLKKEFSTLCRRLDLDPESPEGAAIVVDFLRRFRPVVIDKFRLRLAVEALSERWIAGDPEDVVAALKDLLDNSIGKTLRESDVIAGLPAGARARDLARDPTLHTAIEELRSRFDRSYRYLLIDGRPLGRKESADLSAKLTADDGPRLVLLHGAGGDGKSGVVFEVVEKLHADGVPCLPLRLDRDRPGDSPREFGSSLGLPGSPAGCLEAVAGGGSGVLILDQVDAIRWTSAHSYHAWDTCERAVAEALRHPNLRVVVVCRSFDLEDDARIKAWAKESEAARIQVGPLDDGTVDAAIASRGLSPATLDARQRGVLRSPQALYLWLSLRERDNPPPTFRTMTDLMRAYWKSTRDHMSKLRVGQWGTVLDALIEYMDRRGLPFAPRTVVDRWPSEVDALLSLNVLVEERDRRLLFNHQSSLDFLTAERILRRIYDGSGTVRGWLAEDDQSLFRRGQLRQVLTLLRDDDPEQFLVTMKELLHGDGVRFHLQHLAAQMLGHAEAPTDAEVELVLGMLERPEWADHALYQILVGRESWFDALHRRDVLRSWLEGSDEQCVNRAMSIVEHVVETRGPEIESLLLDQGRERWPGRLATAVWRSSPEKLTEGLFDAAVYLRSRGEWGDHDFVNWNSLALSSPARCIRMLEAKIGSDLDDLEKTPAEAQLGRRDLDDSLMSDDMPSLAGAAAAAPVESWDGLAPSYLKVSRLLRRLRRRSRLAGWDPIAQGAADSARRIRRVLRGVLTAAGRAMAREAPQSFWDRAAPETHQARSIQRLIDRCASQGPDDRANLAIRRFLRKPWRFRPGLGDRGTAYRAAWMILRRYSGICSDELFAELQEAVLAHWPAEEREAYRRHHDRGRREELFGTAGYDVLGCNDLGLGQYLLLSGMPKRRLSPKARDQFIVFRRKFGPAKPLLRGTPRGGAGWVGSTIPDDRLPKVSDRNWLQIIRRDWSNRSRYPKQMAPGRFGQASVEAFASDLGRMAALQPARFARLALRIAVDCDPSYPVAILQSLGERKPPTATVDDPGGEQATVAQIEAIIHRFAPLKGDRRFAMSVCRAIETHHDVTWGDNTLLLLSQLASGHSDPRPGYYAIPQARTPDQAEGGGPDIPASSLNCVRGAAAGAIAALLFDHPNRLGQLQPAIDSLLDDPHAAVRAAAVGLALPLYNIERGVAVEAFLRACAHPDGGVLLSHSLNYFLRYVILDFADRLRPLIGRMVASAINDVAKTGATWAALAWAHRGLFDDIMSNCADGTRGQRMGVAGALTSAAARGHDRPEVMDRLRSLFDDPEKEVRDAASMVFREASFLGRSSAPSLADAFLDSRARDDNIDDLLRGLESLPGALKSYSSAICRVAERFSGPLAAEARDYRTRRPLDAGLLAKVLLRLYEQPECDRELRRRCLDAWDALLRQGIGHDVLQDVDA